MAGLSVYLRVWCAGLLLLPMLMLPTTAAAAIDQSQLERLQLDIWRIRGDFHMYTVMGGDRQYARQLNQSISNGQRAFQSLTSTADSDAEIALVDTLNDSWRDFVSAAGSNTIAELGYTETYAAQDVNRLAAVMSNQLNNFATSAEGDYHDLWALAAYMQRMASEYLALAADPSGGMAVDTGEGRIEFRDTVPAFDRMLADMRRKYRDDDAVNRALDQVASKWAFIRESLVKFYENAVPFLVHRYTQQIIESIDQVAD
ncbi:hypothetical protein [Isoalcanivorax indicus]|uniref:hypothetical protein n=1 Tax=Isoalcanivorax indicus TaxID=2202653 RepID=UPI0013C53A61|nr:hypothetical protein [Isoalcanivorax indicus]